MSEFRMIANYLAQSVRFVRFNIANNSLLDAVASREITNLEQRGYARTIALTLLSGRVVDRIAVQSKMGMLPEVLIRSLALFLFYEDAPKQVVVPSSKRGVVVVPNIAEVENLQQNGAAFILGGA